MVHPEGMRAGARELSIAAVLLGAATLVAFGPALGGAFLTWDDDRFVDHDPAAQALTAGHVKTMFTTAYAEAYHPLHRLANAVDRAAWGHHAAGYHATSLVLWAMALVAVFALFRELGANRVAALAGALVVGLHPLQAEVAAWISGKKDILALLFCASAATAALGATTLRSRRSVAALCLYALALLSKTTVVVLPVLLVLADVLLRGRPLREALRRAAPFASLALAAGVPVLFLWTEAHMIPPSPATGLVGRAAWVGEAIFHHASKMLWPARLSILYPSVPGPTLSRAALAGLAILAGCLTAPWWPRLGLSVSGRVRFGVAWIGVALLPVSNVVPLTFFVADRYASLALVGIGWLCAVLVDDAWQRDASRRGAPALAAVLVVATVLAVATRARAAQFVGDEPLLRAAVAAQPRSYFAHMKLGEILRDAGDLAGSLREYQAAIDLDPERTPARGGLFLAVARDETRRKGLDPLLPERALTRYMPVLDDARGLLVVTSALRRDELTDTSLLPLERSLTLAPWSDERLRAEATRALHARDRKTALLLLRHLRARGSPIEEALRTPSPPAR